MDTYLTGGLLSRVLAFLWRCVRPFGVVLHRHRTEVLAIDRMPQPYVPKRDRIRRRYGLGRVPAVIQRIVVAVWTSGF